MRMSDLEKIRKLEASYRGQLIQESLRNAAEALAREAGMAKPAVLRKDPSQFPFQAVLDKQVAQIEVQHRRLLEAVPDAIVVVNDRREIVLLNLSAETLFGYPRDELLGREITTIVARDLDERLLLVLAGAPKTTAAKAGAATDFTGRRKDGSEFPIEVTLNPLDGSKGRLVIAAMRDGTARAAAARRMALEMARFQGLIEAAPDAMVVANKRGKIVLLNAGAEDQFGYNRGELVGQKVTAILSQGLPERPLAEPDPTADDPAREPGAASELVGRRKDGSEFPVEITVGWSADMRDTLAMAAIRDVSRRKAADRHVVEMEAHYRGLLDAAPDALVVMDHKGGIVLFNTQAEATFGYSRDEVVLLGITKIVPHGLAERLTVDDFRSAEDVLAHQTGIGIELEGRRKDGTLLPIEVMLSRRQAAGGLLVTAAIRDISVRKEAERRAQQ